MSNAKHSSGIGFCGALFLVFLTLRLTEHIDWAWYWVAAPLWGPLGIAAALGLVAVVFFGIAGIAEHVQRGRRLSRAAARIRERDESRTP
jgi:hypothetical protein